MNKIPKFALKQATEIQSILTQENVPFEIEAVNTTTGVIGGVTEYIFLVADEFFEPATMIIGAYLGIYFWEESSGFSGPCPACTTEVDDSKECPECGLSLSYDIEEADLTHPFAVFLKEQRLI